jgi:hypothetical protein
MIAHKKENVEVQIFGLYALNQLLGCQYCAAHQSLVSMLGLFKGSLMPWIEIQLTGMTGMYSGWDASLSVLWRIDIKTTVTGSLNVRILLQFSKLNVSTRITKA